MFKRLTKNMNKDLSGERYRFRFLSVLDLYINTYDKHDVAAMFQFAVFPLNNSE